MAERERERVQTQVAERTACLQQTLADARFKHDTMSTVLQASTTPPHRATLKQRASFQSPAPPPQEIQNHQEEVDDVKVKLDARDDVVVAPQPSHDLMRVVYYEGTEENCAKERKRVAGVDADEPADARVDDKRKQRGRQEEPHEAKVHA